MEIQLVDNESQSDYTASDIEEKKNLIARISSVISNLKFQKYEKVLPLDADTMIKLVFMPLPELRELAKKINA